MRLRLSLAISFFFLFAIKVQAQSLEQNYWAKSLCGKWFGKGVVMGDSVVYSASIHSVLANNFLVINLSDTALKPAYVAAIYIGYDSGNARFICHWLDDSGANNSTILGYGKMKDRNLVEFQFDYPGSPMQTSIGLEEGAGAWFFNSIFVTARGTPQTFGEVHFYRR